MKHTLGALMVASALASGCATTNTTSTTTTTTAPAGTQANARQAVPGDPWESWNRKVYAFNDSIDRNVLAPVARGYAAVVPELARQGISNFFGNFGDVWSAVNSFLQLKPGRGFEDVMRVGTNTVFGLGGLFDVATPLGIEKHGEDFGQTLGRYGVGAGPYVVLPLFGPSNIRDTAAFPLDHYVSPALFTHDEGVKIGIYAIQLVNTRARLLNASQLVNEASIDTYSFVRDAYIQRRQNAVYDGNPPSLDVPAPAGDPDAPK